jgi:anti-sigma factor RsiW
MAKPAPLSEQERTDLVAYLDGELAGATARRIEARLALDARVRAEADAFKQVWELLDHLPQAEPSPHFTQQTLSRLTAPATRPMPARSALRRYRPWLLAGGWAAALFLATWVGFAGFNRAVPREPTEQELVRDVRVIDNKRLYELIDDLEFLHELDHPDLFGDEVRGS